jgi:hypothetical protein
MSCVRALSALVLSITLLLLAGGCNQPAEKKAAAAPGGVLLSVEFPKDTVLKYHIVSSRSVVINLDSKSTRPEAGAVQETREEADMVISYRAVGNAGRGGTRVEARCESAKVTRQRLTGGTVFDDAISTLAGKTYTISVSATGQIFETSELEKVIKELGDAAFGGRGDRYEGRRIKNPDMIGDFILAQWYMWDQEQCVPKPMRGVAIGEQWSSKRRLLTPFPWVARTGRNATYTLAGVEKTPQGGENATITSTYSLADEPSMDWPMPYTGTFSQRSSFGFFQGYRVLELSGEGTQVFDVTAGRIVSDTQKYKAKVSAMIPFGGLGRDGEKPEPNIIVDQTVKVELVPAAAPAK